MDGNLQQILAAANNMSAGANASDGGVTGMSRQGKPEVKSNPIVDALTKRMLQQTKGISSSASSELSSTIADAIKSTESAGASTAARLQSEREREVAFARGQANATYTTALEGRTGYGTQVAALRELTDTTEKSIRDIDKRYQEALLANDAATAQSLSNLKIQKLQFQMEQEQNFFNNLIAVGNLQQDALNQQMQNEQFWAKKEQEDIQFVMSMANSNLQFEKTYGLQLQEMALKEKQLEIERQRYNLSVQEYNDKKKALAQEKNYTNTKAIIANGIKMRLASAAPGTNISQADLLSPNFMLQMKEETGFDGTTEELAAVINEAYSDITSDSGFMNSIQSSQPISSNKSQSRTSTGNSTPMFGTTRSVNNGKVSYNPIASNNIARDGFISVYKNNTATGTPRFGI